MFRIINKALLIALVLAVFLPAMARAQNVPNIGNPPAPVSISNPLPVNDPNNASYVNAFAMTVGSTYAAGRALQVDCPTAGGAIVMDLASGQQDTLNVVSSAQSQFFPFSLTEVVSGPSGCTYHDLP